MFPNQLAIFTKCLAGARFTELRQMLLMTQSEQEGESPVDNAEAETATALMVRGEEDVREDAAGECASIGPPNPVSAAIRGEMSVEQAVDYLMNHEHGATAREVLAESVRRFLNGYEQSCRAIYVENVAMGADPVNIIKQVKGTWQDTLRKSTDERNRSDAANAFARVIYYQLLEHWARTVFDEGKELPAWTPPDAENVGEYDELYLRVRAGILQMRKAKRNVRSDTDTTEQSTS